MNEASSPVASRLVRQVGRGRTVVYALVTDIVLFVVANVTYGNGNDKHGAMRTVSNVVWAFFLVGFVVMVVLAVAALAQSIRRRRRLGHQAA